MSPAEATEQEDAEQEEGLEQQEPSLSGSLPAKEQDGESEADEAARLAQQATVSEDETKAAALTAAEGTVTASELGNVNGSIVWQVEVQQADRSLVEVKVDAGNGTVLAQEADDDGDEGCVGVKRPASRARWRSRPPADGR